MKEFRLAEVRRGAGMLSIIEDYRNALVKGDRPPANIIGKS
jgi:hypothetical protein